MIKRHSVSATTGAIIHEKSNLRNASLPGPHTSLPAPHAISRDPSVSPQIPPSNIPTGPRALQQRSPLGLKKSVKTWPRSNYGRPPSLPNSPPKKDADDNKEYHPPEATSPGRVDDIIKDNYPDNDVSKVPASQHLNSAEETLGSSSTKLPIRSSPPPMSSFESTATKELQSIGKDQDLAHIPDFGQMSEDEEDDNVVFNREYMDERKRIFEKDIQQLRADMPPPPLEDPTIQSMLMRIQLLGIIANEGQAESVLEQLTSTEKELTVSKTNDPVLTLTPAVVDEEAVKSAVSAPQEVTQVTSSPIVTRAEITMETLPFLTSGPPTPLSDMDICHETDSAHDMKSAILAELTKRRKQVAKKNAILRERYMAIYKPWRIAIWEMDQQKAQARTTPGPASPPPSMTPVTPAPVPEGREGRRYKGNSQLDLENALKASQITAQQELERRRMQEATVYPDLSREAIIPDMIEPQVAKASIFKDFNNLVDAHDAMDVFGFKPLPTDFTEEEQKIFTNAFMADPKKWGKIAESLPGRNFQQCILHYYRTKEASKYKAKLNKKAGGRRRAKANKSNKSNALIAPLGEVKPEFQGEDEPAPVTDTGRPRRAAAPTFGPTFGESTTESDSLGNNRRTKDSEVVERSTGLKRGGGRGGARTKGKSKATQPDNKTQGPQPQLNPSLTPFPKTDIYLDGVDSSLLPPTKESVEKDAATPRPRAGRGRKDGQFVFDTTDSEPLPKQSDSAYGSLQPTSYWSVPEQRDFPRLLAHFGRDFEGISNFMKTKTTVMVKNYFQRGLEAKKDFEDVVSAAEDKKTRGEPTGPLPVPSGVPKRRYEATPSAIIPRPLAPHGDMMMEVEEGRFTGQGPPPMSILSRNLTDAERAKRYPPLSATYSAAGTTLMEDEAARRAGMHPPGGAGASRIAGPRLGYFTNDDHRESVILPHSSRVQDMQIPSRHTSTADLSRMDPLSSASYVSGQPSSITPGHSRHPSLTQVPGSPSQLPRPDERSTMHWDAQGRAYYRPLQPVSMPSQSPRPVLSPVKDNVVPSTTPVPESTPRQVPAKRSNIMSILNDEPEEPQPRKRFANEPPSGPMSTPQARPGYYTPLSEDEKKRRSGYYGDSNVLPRKDARPHRSQASSEAELQLYLSGRLTGPSNSNSNDWMARFDPRAQQSGSQQQLQPPERSSQQSSHSPALVASRSPFSRYASVPSQQASAMGNLSAPPSAAATPPPGAPQRLHYSSVFNQVPESQSHSLSGSRDMTPQPSAYRPNSPSSRTGGVLSRPEPTSTQSSSSIYGLKSQHPSSQSYQQHVQTLVNGSHHSSRSTSVGMPGPVMLPGGPSQYGHNTPPPQGGRPMPSMATLGRSFTPPASMHPGAMGYAPPPSLHQRPPGPGSLADPGSVRGHHRVYSQGSVQGGLPGPLNPSSQTSRQ